MGVRSVGGGRNCGLTAYWRTRGADEGLDGPHYQQRRRKRECRQAELGAGGRRRRVMNRIKDLFVRVTNRVPKSRAANFAGGAPEPKESDAKAAAGLLHPNPVGGGVARRHVVDVPLPSLFSFF